MTDDIKPPRKPRARPTELGAAKPLTDLQARFVEEYLLDMNASAAAVRAGYGPNTKSVYSAVLQRPHVRAAVDAAIAERAARTRVSADQVVGELAKVAFANMADYVTFADDGSARFDLARIDRAAGAAVSKLTVEYFPGAEGGESRRVRAMSVTLGDKKAALLALGRHLGMDREAPVGPTPIVVVTGVPRSPEFGNWGSGGGVAALPDLGD